MYKTLVDNQINELFNELYEKCISISKKNNDEEYSINKINDVISRELNIRSKSMIVDVLYRLNEQVLSEPFFYDVSINNQFRRLNLIDSIPKELPFSFNQFYYNYAYRNTRYIVISISLTVLGLLLIIKETKIFSISTLLMSIIIGLSIGSIAFEYNVWGPKRRQAHFELALNIYLKDLRDSYLDWFVKIENYFYLKVDEFKSIK